MQTLRLVQTYEIFRFGTFLSSPYVKLDFFGGYIYLFIWEGDPKSDSPWPLSSTELYFVVQIYAWTLKWQLWRPVRESIIDIFT